VDAGIAREVESNIDTAPRDALVCKNFRLSISKGRFVIEKGCQAPVVPHKAKID